MKFNYKMVVAYDGTKYSGWQRNKNAAETIQQKLDTTLSKFFDEKIDVIGSGRTDKGVHARGQVANFLSTKELDTREALISLNHYLPEDISIKSIEKADERFHARFNASSKRYSYTLIKGYKGFKPVFDRKYVSILENPLRVNRMEQAARLFVGEHDFKGFSSDRTKKTCVRTIENIWIEEDDEKIVFQLVGNGFLYHMVRIIVGTLIEVGQKSREIETINQIFENKVRSEAGYLTPPEGLFLEEVTYEAKDTTN